MKDRHKTQHQRETHRDKDALVLALFVVEDPEGGKRQTWKDGRDKGRDNGERKRQRETHRGKEVIPQLKRKERQRIWDNDLR